MEFTQGNVLDAPTEAVVNTVNCVGVMGRGIAAQFKRAYPENFQAYAIACKRGEVVPGKMFVFDTGRLTAPRYIVNFPTKRHWRGKSRIEDIQTGLEALVADVERLQLRSIALPPLGCGLGGLNWADVRPLIEAALSRLPDVRVVVYEPTTDAVPHDTAPGDVPKMTPGRAVLVGLMERYLAGWMDPTVSLLEVHKLMYFAQEAGEPLRLAYVKGAYGPYAENLRHVLRTVEGYFVSGYGDGGDAPNKELALIPGALQDAHTLLAAHSDTRARFERVAQLVQGFESAFGMELLATTHWVVTRESAHGPDIARAVYAWNPRKRMFTPEQIDIAHQHLLAAGWLDPVADPA